MRRLKIDRRIVAAALAVAAAASAAAAVLVGFGGADVKTTTVTETTFQQLVPAFQRDGQGGVHVAVWDHSTEKTYEVRETETTLERRLVDTIETRRLAGEGSWPDDYVAAARANGWGLDQLNGCTEHLLRRAAPADLFIADQCWTMASGIVTGDFESIRGLSATLTFETASR